MMGRLTARTDLGLDDYNEICFINPDDPEGTYNLDDIVNYGSDETKLAIAERLAQYEDAEAEGRLVILDDRLAVSMCAGARAIETNMNRMAKRYVYDVYKGEPTISYKEAAQILRGAAEKALKGESK